MGANAWQFVLDGQWVGGVDSLLYPTDLAQGGYAWGVNVINRGGVIQTRPGKRLVQSFCGRLAQGHHWCRTIDDRNFELVAIDGLVYVSAFPFNNWTQLSGVAFSSTAPRIYFETALQAYTYDISNNIVLLPNPVNIVLMQDGVSTPCFWNAMDQSSGTVDDTSVPGFGVPMMKGTVMLWQDNRLWLAKDNLVFASDLLYPQSFSDETALATKSGFRFPRAVVDLKGSPVQGVLVKTDSSLHSLQSFIQDRTQWQTTQGFQNDVNLEVGQIAPLGSVLLHGMPWLFTARGLISYDRALTQNLTTVILTVDGEMQRSKDLLSPDVRPVCMGAWENVLLVSVPASSLYNRHTWVMDAGIAEKLNAQGGMCWTAIWTGTYPVQWTSPIVGGTQHCYELSYSAGFLALNQGDSPSPQPETDKPLQAYIHLWENFIPNQIDAVETDIMCAVETRAYTLSTDDYYRFVFAELMIVNLKGVVPVQVYVTGLAGNYQPLFTTTLRADVGPWGNPDSETVLYYIAKGGTTLFESYRRQVRHMRTQEFIVHQSPDGAACVEIQRQDGIDKAFQLMIQWQGRMGIRQLKFFYDRQLQSPQGQCPVDESATPHITLEATAPSVQLSYGLTGTRDTSNAVDAGTAPLVSSPSSQALTALVPQTGMPPNYQARSREIIYDAIEKSPRFVKNPFGPQKLYLARSNHHW
jgi:hypothetical protein